MKSLAFVAAVMLALSTPAYALSIGGFEIGAHNPVFTDDPAVPNCTLFGPNSYANNPGCESVHHQVDGFVTTPGSASCSCPWEVFVNEHCVKS